MAAGDYRLKVLGAAIYPQDKVIVGYQFGVEDGSGSARSTLQGRLVVTWDDFVAMTTSQERQALASINGKLKDEIKARNHILADALDL
jgi:hypothetical protein